MTVVIHLAAIVILLLGVTCQLFRWWRVLQREHYIASSLIETWWRWLVPPASMVVGDTLRRTTRVRLAIPVGAMGMLVSVAVSATSAPAGGALTGLTLMIFPWGLSIRGRTSRLAFTRRMMTVAIASVLIVVTGLAISLLCRSAVLAVLVSCLVPLWVALATVALAPVEERSAQRFVTAASTRLRRVQPRVIAITGSFGKTSTKNHLATLLGGVSGVVATPRSFNNRAGLSRSINENLSDGTRIFIAEMGTYGPGEIAALCDWCPPEISVVTAIGEVHLERMGTLDNIERAKREITTTATTVVLNGDDARLMGWVDSLRAEGKTVITAGTTPSSDLSLLVDGDRWVVTYEGESVAIVPAIRSIHPTNVACALAAGIAAGVPMTDLTSRISDISPVANRAVVATAASGVMVIDDTFNANPVSARASLDTLVSLPISGRRVVVTPGLVEMGSRRVSANQEFARAVIDEGAELIVVGRTNARALVRGSRSALRARRRDDAVTWVRANLGQGDGVLYLNDLPDHYS